MQSSLQPGVTVRTEYAGSDIQEILRSRTTQYRAGAQLVDLFISVHSTPFLDRATLKPKVLGAVGLGVQCPK